MTSPSPDHPEKSGRSITPLPWSFYYAIKDRGGESFWKQSTGLLFVPALIVLLAIEFFAGLQPTVIWLSFVAFSILYAGLVLFVFRRR
jgi:hypothetical protein